MSGEILKNGFGLIEFPPESTRVKIFDIVSIGKLVEFTLTAFDGVKNDSKSDGKNNSYSGGSNKGKKSNFGPSEFAGGGFSVGLALMIAGRFGAGGEVFGGFLDGFAGVRSKLFDTSGNFTR